MTTPIPVHHDDVLKAVTTIARTLINSGVTVDFASAMALSLSKVIHADVELTIEEINKSIAEGSIKSPTAEPEEGEASQDPGYEATVTELPGQKPDPTEQVSSKIKDDEEPKSTGRFDFTPLIKPDTEMQVKVVDEEGQPDQELAEEPVVDSPSQEKAPMKEAEPEQQQKKNLDQICAVCSSPVRPGKKFCTHCGAIRCNSCKTFVKRDKECSNCHALL